MCEMVSQVTRRRTPLWNNPVSFLSSSELWRFCCTVAMKGFERWFFTGVVQLLPSRSSKVSNRGKDSPPRRVSGLSHDSICGRLRVEMRLVWSWFVLFLFNCTLMFLLFVCWSACLLIWSFFILFIIFLICNAVFLHKHTNSLWPPAYLPHPHMLQHPPPHPPTAPPMCRRWISDWLSCSLAVTESQWTDKERWQ